MAAVRKLKSYLTQEGEVVFVDPDAGHLPLIRRFAPGFEIRSAPPLPGFQPNLVRTRRIMTGLTRETLAEADDELLWDLHTKGLAGRLPNAREGTATFLDLKVELARRELLDCWLCGHACGVNRFLKPGKCGLREKGYVAETFIHVAEEAPVTPAGSIKLFQCALNCDGCQVWEVIHIHEAVMAKHGRVLDESVWQTCSDFDRAATIEFVGGNPTESLYAILKVLTTMPPTLSGKPLVWNDHGYTMPVAYDLLHGIVDAYLPDFKGCDPCVERISKVTGYWGCMTSGIDRMLTQPARIIVRILLLPGHVACCHAPALRWLGQFKDRLWVSLLPFIPDYRALKDPQLNRRTSAVEMAEVKSLMHSLALRDVEEKPEEFWRTLA
jgi:putative pyruvate formate lyase activating enzyme